MLIVLEGADGTGKSTFANKLAGALPGARVLHRGPPAGPALAEYLPELENYDPRRQHLVLDRWHWGELIYGPLYRGGSSLDEAGWRHVSLLLAAKGGVVVYLDAGVTAAEHMARLVALQEDFLRPEDVRTALAAYANLAVRALEEGVTSVRLVRGYGTRQHLVRTLALAGQLAREAATGPHAVPGYVGARRPRLLLFGDVRNAGAATRYRSCFVPEPNTSGHYLLTALPRSALAGVGLCNANEVDAHGTWLVLGRPEAVALGGNARRTLTARGVPHRHVPHPQWWRCFRHHDQAAYGRLLTGEDTWS